jgi:hypothetical protein
MILADSSRARYARGASPVFPAAFPEGFMKPSQCVILVPVAHHIEPACEDGLRKLEQRGYPVRRIYGYSAIDVARNQMASDALAEGFEELMWIDADILFDPVDVERLRSHGIPVVTAVYPKRGRREMACAFLHQTESVTLGRGGGLIEILYAGFGFTYTHRVLYDRMLERLKLPVCNEQFGRALVPFFAPSAVKDTVSGGWWYLAEDYSFCMRTRQVGVPVMADTSVRLRHVGSYSYTWEDAGGQKELYQSYTFHIRPTEPPADGSSDPARGPLFGGISVDRTATN